jgi:hypothetical protein
MLSQGVAWHGPWHYSDDKKTSEMMEKKNERENIRRTPGDANERPGYDPYKKDPGAGRPEDERVDEAEEQEARRREGVSMGAMERLDDSTTAPVVDTGHAGQMARGSYGFNSSTGQGQYMDRTRDGSADVSADPVEQPADRMAKDHIAGENELNDDERPRV